MASGSCFLILKDSDISLPPQQLLELNLKHAAELDFWSTGKNPKDLIDLLQDTQLVNPDLDKFNEWYSVSSGKVYQCLLKNDFISDFTSLKDHFSIYPYSKNGEIEFSEYEVYKMLEALKYIQNRDLWSHTMENFILDRNEFIYVFDTVSEDFYSRFDDEKIIRHEKNYTLFRLIETFATYMTIKKSSDEPIKIVYKTW
jgi:hypothetical protein